MPVPNLPAFRACIERQDVSGAINLFEPLGDDDKFDLLFEAFAGQEPMNGDVVLIERTYLQLLAFILLGFRGDVTSDKVIFFENFVFATLLVSPSAFLNLLLKNLLKLDSTTVVSFLNRRVALKSSILSYGLDFYLDAGIPQNFRNDKVNLSFETFFEVCKISGAADNSILFPSPSNIVKLASSPYLIDYLLVFERNNVLDKLLAEPVFEMMLSLCSTKSRTSAKNFLLEKKLGRQSTRLRCFFAGFFIFVVIELFQGFATIFKYKKGLVMASGIVKLGAYLVLALATFVVESEVLGAGYFATLTVSNGMFAISVDRLGAMRWILFAAQLLPILVLLKVSDMPILPFGQIRKESSGLNRKIRGFENLLFKRRSFSKRVSATFLLTAVVSIINIVAVFL